MADEHTIFKFTPIFDSRSFNAEGKKSQQLLQKHLTGTKKLTQLLDASVGKVSDDLKRYEKGVKRASDSEVKRMETILGYEKRLAKFEEDLRDAEGDNAKDLEKQQQSLRKDYDKAIKKASLYQQIILKIREANDEISKAERERAVRQDKGIKAAEDEKTVREAIARLHEDEDRRKTDKLTERAGYGGHKMKEEFGDAFKEGIQSIHSGDLMGLAGGVMKAIGVAGKGLHGAATRASVKPGGGGMMGNMSGVLDIISKAAPLVQALSGVLMAVVQIFLDLDAAAKEFNSKILETTSTFGFLEKNFGNANAAASDLNDTMKEIYSQATSLDNLGWGISKETHSQVIGALGAQGVMLDKVKTYFDDIKAGRAQNQGMVKDWGTMVQMSVGYSRAFGVSLSEVTDLQGEMMSKLNMNFDSVQSGFQEMLDGATDAGIASNKFFGQMRGITADLNLFNLRIGEAAKLMGKLDKTMNPERAAQFFSTLTGFMKGKSLMDRTKMVMEAGIGTSKAIGKKDLDSSVARLADDLKTAGLHVTDKEMKDMLSKPSKLTKWMAKNDKKLNTGLRETLIKNSRQAIKLQSNDAITIASAVREFGPAATAREIDAALEKGPIHKSLDKLNGTALAAALADQNMDEQQVEDFVNFKTSLDITKSQLVQKLKDGEKLTEEEAKILKKLNIDTSKSKDVQADQLKKTPSLDVYDAMGQKQQDLLNKSKETMDYAKKQSDTLTSLNTQIGIIADFLKGKLYEVLADVWESILDLAHMFQLLPKWMGGGDSEKYQLNKLQVQAIKANSKELAEVAAKSMSVDDYQKAVYAGAGKQTEAGLASLVEQIDKTEKTDTALQQQLHDTDAELQKKLHEAKTESDRADIQSDIDANKKNTEAQIEANTRMREELTDKLRVITKLMEANAKQGANWTRGTYGFMVDKAAKDAKIDAQTAFNLSNLVSEGSDIGFAFDKLGINTKDQVKILSELRHSMSAAQLTQVTADVGTILGPKEDKLGPTDEEAPNAPGPQQMASEKAEPAPAPVVSEEPISHAAQAAAPTSAKPVTPKDIEKSTEEQGENIESTMDDVRRGIRSKSGGIVLNGPYLKNQYGGQIEDSVYNAATRALFEYWMYQEGDRKDALKAIKGGVNIRDLPANYMKAVAKNVAPNQAFTAKPQATGGVVMRPPPGEAFTSVKPGERIIPAGGAGGGGKLVLELKGDLARIIRATALDTINEHDRARVNR